MGNKHKTRWHEERLARGEVVGGGYIVLRRGRAFGRISIDKGKLPFEHGSYDSAMQECVRLAKQHPGVAFDVWQVRLGMQLEPRPIEEAQS